jgi:hypothetical protein
MDIRVTRELEPRLTTIYGTRAGLMQEILCDVSSSGSGRGGSWALTMLAAVLLSFGVGAATAAFTLMSADSEHAAPFVACETMLQLSSSPSAHPSENIPSADEVQARVSEAYRATYESGYQARYEAAGDAVSSWSDAMDDLDGQSLAPLVAAGALTILVACARGAARMLAEPRGPALALASAAGALFVSAMLISAFGLPAMGLRAVAFAICVSMLAARFTRTARRELVPLRA